MIKLSEGKTEYSLNNRFVNEDIRKHFAVLDELARKFDDYAALPSITMINDGYGR